VTICRACGCIIIDGQCACTQQARETLPLGALCSCGACVDMAGNDAYAPGGSPLVWGPQYCASCGDAVGEPGTRAALEADAARYRALRDGCRAKRHDEQFRVSAGICRRDALHGSSSQRSETLRKAACTIDWLWDRVMELEQKTALLRHRLTLRRSWARAMRKALREERVLLGVAEAELADAKALTAELERLQAGPQSETVGKLLDLAHDLAHDDDRALCEEAAARLQALEREREASAARLG